jgi:hypothetical protein
MTLLLIENLFRLNFISKRKAQQLKRNLWHNHPTILSANQQMNTSFFFSCSFMYNLYSTSAIITCKNVSIFIYYSAYFAFLHLDASHVKVRNTFHFLLSISHIIIIIIASIISKPYDCYYPCTRVLWEYSNVFIHRTYKRILCIHTTAKKNIYRAIAMESMGVYYIGRLTLADVCIHWDLSFTLKWSKKLPSNVILLTETMSDQSTKLNYDW